MNVKIGEKPIRKETWFSGMCDYKGMEIEFELIESIDLESNTPDIEIILDSEDGFNDEELDEIKSQIESTFLAKQ